MEGVVVGHAELGSDLQADEGKHQSIDLDDAGQHVTIAMIDGMFYDL